MQHIISSLLAFIALLSSSFLFGQGNWTSLEPMPTARQEMPSAVMDGKIYVIGGITLLASDVMEVYDPAANSWSSSVSLPANRHHHGTAAVNGKLYIIGGFESVIQFDARDEVYEFDPLNQAWSTKQPLPIKTGASATVTHPQGQRCKQSSTLLVCKSAEHLQRKRLTSLLYLCAMQSARFAGRCPCARRGSAGIQSRRFTCKEAWGVVVAWDWHFYDWRSYWHLHCHCCVCRRIGS